MKKIISHILPQQLKAFVRPYYKAWAKRIGHMSGRLRKAGAAGLRKLGRPHSPDFIIIGTQKSGTTSLHFYLDQHPDICGSKPKELHYFDRRVHAGESLAQYESAFRSIRKKLHFESTPYYIYQPGALELIKKTYPGIRLITVLRDPVKRAFSAWNHYRQTFGNKHAEQFDESQRPGGQLLYNKLYEGRQTALSFRECLDIELELIRNKVGFEPSILRKGLYLEQLRNCWNLFGKDRLLILGFSDLIADPKAVLNKVADFVGARDVGWDFLDPEPKNTRSYPSVLQDKEKSFLEEFYREPNRRLFAELGPINW
jgi:hypothetical protein